MKRFTNRQLLWVLIAVVLIGGTAAFIGSFYGYRKGYDSGYKTAWRDRGFTFGLPFNQLDVMPPRKSN